MSNRNYYITRVATLIIVVGILLLILWALSGCYSIKKAEQQVNRAAVSYPVLLAKKARSLFPCDTSSTVTMTSSDSLGYQSVIDQLIEEINRLSGALGDTVIIAIPGDTTCTAEMAIIRSLRKQIADLKPKIIRLPPIHDTVRIRTSVIDQAAVQVCQSELSKVIAAFEPVMGERDKWKKKAKSRFWIILAMGAVIGVSVFAKVRSLIKPKT